MRASRRGSPRPARLVCPLVETANLGLNARLLQPPAANALATCATACPAPETLAVTCCALQLVGLNMNPGRSISTVTRCRRSGTPNTICGSGPFVTRDGQHAGFRVHVDPRADDHQSQVERPRDGVRDDAQPERRARVASREVYVAADFKRVRARAGRHARRPDLRCYRAGARLACGSPHSGTLESIPSRPGGVWTWIPVRSVRDPGGRSSA